MRPYNKPYSDGLVDRSCMVAMCSNNRDNNPKFIWANENALYCLTHFTRMSLHSSGTHSSRSTETPETILWIRRFLARFGADRELLDLYDKGELVPRRDT